MRILVYSVPRSGTHVLVRSIALSAGIPFRVPLDIHGSTGQNYVLPTDPDWVIGVHTVLTEKLKTLLNSAGVQKVAIERHPLDNLLAFTAMAKVKIGPNSKEYLNDEYIDLFSQYLSCLKQWKECSTVISYEGLVDPLDQNHAETIETLKKLLNIDEFIVEERETTKEAAHRYYHGNTSGPGLWKKVFTKETILLLEPVLGVTIDTTGIELPTNPKDGDAVYFEVYENLLNSDQYM